MARAPVSKTGGWGFEVPPLLPAALLAGQFSGKVRGAGYFAFPSPNPRQLIGCRAIKPFSNAAVTGAREDKAGQPGQLRI